MKTISVKTITVKVAGEIISAKVVKENALTAWVELSDGNIIKRHKRHIVSILT